MATTKPRITITLSTRQHEVLKSISECSGQPMSGFLNELLDLSLPTLERMAATFQKIKTAQDAQRQKIIAELDVAQTAMEPIVQSMTGQFDLFMARVEQAAVGAPVPAAGGADAPAAASRSPSTNRGDTPRKEKQRQPSTGKASRPVRTAKVLKKNGG